MINYPLPVEISAWRAGDYFFPPFGSGRASGLSGAFVSPDADAVYASMRGSGVDADEVLRWEGVPPMFAFRDQDGNGMEIVEQR